MSWLGMRKAPARWWRRSSFSRTGRIALLVRNPAGIEALATLSVLYVHFESMLPYVYGQLARQREELDALGEEGWLASKGVGLAPGNEAAAEPVSVRVGFIDKPRPSAAAT